MIINGNALYIPLKDNSVQCVVTSPPYYGLRMYATAKWIGGDPLCDHIIGNQVQDNKANGAITHGVRPGCDSSTCKICGAKRKDEQIGLESTVEEYVSKMVQVFREVKRVLRNDGCLFLNLGDSYYGNCSQDNSADCNLKPKDLCGIPWRVAFALQEDGWWLRQDIIWAKKNPMPESVSDRCSKSHEYIFLLTKSSKYFWDQEAIKECAAYDGRKDTLMKGGKKYKNGFMPNQSQQSFHVMGHERWQKDETGQRVRNKRSVWSIPTQPYKGSHFATFPEKLVEPCVLAGTSAKGMCHQCGAPWVRVITRNNPSKTYNNMVSDERYDGLKNMGGNHQTVSGLHRNNGGVYSSAKTIGWKPSCKCDPGEPIPCIVFDPFAGSCTTGVVAERYGRNFIGLELSKEYINLGKQRMQHNQMRLVSM